MVNKRIKFSSISRKTRVVLEKCLYRLLVDVIRSTYAKLTHLTSHFNQYRSHCKFPWVKLSYPRLGFYIKGSLQANLFDQINSTVSKVIKNLKTVVQTAVIDTQHNSDVLFYDIKPDFHSFHFVRL